MSRPACAESVRFQISDITDRDKEDGDSVKHISQPWNLLYLLEAETQHSELYTIWERAFTFTHQPWKAVIHELKLHHQHEPPLFFFIFLDRCDLNANECNHYTWHELHKVLQTCHIYNRLFGSVTQGFNIYRREVYPEIHSADAVFI